MALAGAFDTDWVMQCHHDQHTCLGTGVLVQGHTAGWR